MKLFCVDVMDDTESESVVVVAETKEEAEYKVSKMDWSCFMFAHASEISVIDGYEVKLKKIKKRGRKRDRKKINSPQEEN